MHVILYDGIMPCEHEINGLRMLELLLAHKDATRPLVAEVKYIITELGLSEPESMG